MKNKTHKIWIIALIIACILLLANTAYAIWGFGDNKSNILTLISGWISGIATAFIGVITIIQTKKYKAEADDSLEKQYQFETAKLVLSSRATFVQETKKQFMQFIDVYDCNVLLQKVKEVVSLSNPTVKTVHQNHIELEIDFFYNTLESRCLQLINTLNSDIVLTKENENTKECILQYLDTCNNNKIQNYVFLRTLLLPIYENLMKAIVNYFHSLDIDLANSISKIRNNKYIVEHYKTTKI